MSFKFSDAHSQPPFYTKQLNETVWASQLSLWESEILKYCRFYKIWTLDLNRHVDDENEPGMEFKWGNGGVGHRGEIDGELFNNKSIHRSLRPQVVKEIFNDMVKKQSAEWTSDDILLVYFKRPSEWATSIADWIDATGQHGVVLTLYEITKGEMATGKDFADMHPEILKKVLDVLVSRGQAVLMKNGKQLAGVKML